VATRESNQQRGPVEGVLRGARPTALSTVGLVFVAILGVWLLINLIKEPQDFFTVFLIGLTTGLVYALVALG
jgi:hypothetical protein